MLTTPTFRRSYLLLLHLPPSPSSFRSLLQHELRSSHNGEMVYFREWEERKVWSKSLDFKPGVCYVIDASFCLEGITGLCYLEEGRVAIVAALWVKGTTEPRSLLVSSEYFWSSIPMEQTIDLLKYKLAHQQHRTWQICRNISCEQHHLTKHPTETKNYRQHVHVIASCKETPDRKGGEHVYDQWYLKNFFK